jgi:hypothetical protein
MSSERRGEGSFLSHEHKEARRRYSALGDRSRSRTEADVEIRVDSQNSPFNGDYPGLDRRPSLAYVYGVGKSKG